MRKILTILLLFISLTLSATTYYLDPSGNDGAEHTGLIGDPWHTLGYAVTRVSGGDIIHVNSGDYALSAQVLIPVNVSIEGVGDASRFISSLADDTEDGGVIFFNGGTNTAQHVWNIKLDGNNLTGYRGMGIYARNNVEIYHCTVVDFYTEGVRFYGAASNSSFTYNTVINCGRNPDHKPNVYIGSTTNFEFAYNVVTQTARGVDYNGNGVSGYEASYGMKFHHNVITATPYLTDYIWKFAVELWYQSGLELYENEIIGECDLGKDVTYGGYSYGIYCHNNTFGWSSLQSVSTIGLQLEQTAQGVIVCRNTFKNVNSAIYFCQYNYIDDYVEDVWVFDNLMYGVGLSGTTTYGWGIRFQTGADSDSEYPPTYVTNVNVWHNTLVADPTHPAYYGIELPTEANTSGVTYIEVKDNIIIGFNQAGIYAHQQDNDYTPYIDYLNITKNLLYGNGNSNNTLINGFTPGHYTYDTHIKTDPSFVNGYHINASSPAYHTGVVVTFPLSIPNTDIGGIVWADPPSIGCYEFTGVYYVATAAGGGDDSHPGTLAEPWLTWGKAFTSTSVNAGDTVYFRGGVYPMTVSNGNGYAVTRAGTSSAWIVYSNYPEEIPILDCDAITPTGYWSSGVGADVNTGANYIKFIGLTIRNVWQKTDSWEIQATGWGCQNGYFMFERCNAYNIDGHGFNSFFDPAISYADGIHRFISCDAYNCSNAYAVPPALPGNAGSGFASYNFYDTQGHAYFKGCRAWLCGDQGFAIAGDNYIEADSCWSFSNGLLQGGGNGFKLGWVDNTSSEVRRVMKNCIAAFNRICGITTNDADSPVVCHMNLYNNTMYHNGYYAGYEDYGFGFWLDNTTASDAEELLRVFKNNISYDNAIYAGLIVGGASYTHDHNTWDASVTVTDADFVTVDSTGISGARQADGSLPNIGFLKLTTGSDLIDAGVDVGLPYNYVAPDIGFYEFLLPSSHKKVRYGGKFGHFNGKIGKYSL